MELKNTHKVEHKRGNGFGAWNLPRRVTFTVAAYQFGPLEKHLEARDGDIETRNGYQDFDTEGTIGVIQRSTPRLRCSRS